MRLEHQQEETEQTTLPVITPLAETAPVAVSDRVEMAASGIAETDVTARKIAALGKALRKRKRIVVWSGVPVAGIAMTIPLLILVLFRAGDARSSLAHALISSLVAYYMGLLWICFCGLPAPIKALRALANTDDRRCIGVMAEALSGGDMANSLAASVLIRLLPQMRPEEAALLTPSQRRGLRDGLLHATNRLKFVRYNPTLALAILNALERIGDVEDLSVVMSLARRPAKTEEQRSVREAAQACLSVLEARVAGVERLASPLSEERRQAPTQLSPEAVETLSSQLRQIGRLRGRNLKITATGAFSGLGLAMTSLIHAAPGHATSPFLMVGMLSSLGIIGLFAARGLYTQRNLTQALMHADDLRFIGPLVETAASGEVGGAVAATVLTPLLNRLQASDAGLLDANGRDKLNKALFNHRENTEFVLAALKALQQIGDARALPMVQRMADRKDRSAAGQRVREAALECLPFLQLRAAQEKDNQMLLRASEGYVTPPNTLLRPVQDTTQIGAEELLRPGTPRPEYAEESERDEEQTDCSSSPFAIAGA